MFYSNEKNGRTPLTCAAQHGHEMIVDYLLKAGADVNGKFQAQSRTKISLNVCQMNMYFHFSFCVSVSHTHTYKSKAKPTAAMRNIAIAAQWTSTGMPVHHSGTWALCSWGRARNPQEDCPSLMERGRGTWSSTMTPTPLSKTRTVGHLLPQFTPGTYWCYSWVGFPSWHQVTRFPINRWVSWSNVSEISCSRKQQQQTPKWLNRESNLGPFNYQASTLTTWLCCLTAKWLGPSVCS